MTLINESASLPSPMWAMVRFLITVGGSCTIENAEAMLCPPTLLPAESQEKDPTFRYATRTLRELGLVIEDDGHLSLAPSARRLSAGDTTGFSELLRAQVLDPARNADLTEGDGLTGTKDLVRALAWFLSRDPYVSLNWDDVIQLQDGALIPQVGNPFANGVRWNRFSYWAPVLGLASQAVLKDERAGHPLVPDCTVAVRQTVLAAWKQGQIVEAAAAIERILAELPVLPGGRYACSLGLHPPDHVSPALSFALLCGQDQGWIELKRRSDAARDIFLADPDTTAGTRRVSDVAVTGSIRG